MPARSRRDREQPPDRVLWERVGAFGCRSARHNSAAWASCAPGRSGGNAHGLHRRHCVLLDQAPRAGTRVCWSRPDARRLAAPLRRSCSSAPEVDDVVRIRGERRLPTGLDRPRPYADNAVQAGRPMEGSQGAGHVRAAAPHFQLLRRGRSDLRLAGVHRQLEQKQEGDGDWCQARPGGDRDCMRWQMVAER